MYFENDERGLFHYQSGTSEPVLTLSLSITEFNKVKTGRLNIRLFELM